MDFLVDLVEEISTTLDEGDYAVSIFLDFSKAFDTVNHAIPLSKLLFHAISNSDISWLFEQKETKSIFKWCYV